MPWLLRMTESTEDLQVARGVVSYNAVLVMNMQSARVVRQADPATGAFPIRFASLFKRYLGPVRDVFVKTGVYVATARF